MKFIFTNISYRGRPPRYSNLRKFSTMLRDICESYRCCSRQVGNIVINICSPSYAIWRCGRMVSDDRKL